MAGVGGVGPGLARPGDGGVGPRLGPEMDQDRALCAGVAESPGWEACGSRAAFGGALEAGSLPLQKAGGGGAAAAEDAYFIRAQTSQAAWAHSGTPDPIMGAGPGPRWQGVPQSLGKRVASDRALWAPAAPGRQASRPQSRPSTLRQAGRGEEGARPEAPRARRRRVPLFLGASSRAGASRGRLGLRGGGGERRARGRGYRLLAPGPPASPGRWGRGPSQLPRPGPGTAPRQGPWAAG